MMIMSVSTMWSIFVMANILMFLMMRIDKLLCTGVKLSPLVDTFGKLEARILAQIFNGDGNDDGDDDDDDDQ